jgi:predicted anti-sigma-YlaC factor YlaD
MSVDELTCKELVEMVTDYLEGRLSTEARLRVEEHLAFCSWCGTYLQQMRDTIRVNGMLTEEDLSPEDREKLLDVFRDWKGR